MLVLKNIKKDYLAGGDAVPALKGISIAFRANEFVSILGPSGCGKTTLLNIIGGLDRYTTGDLLINGRSTKSFKDGDWDTYRNHSIGFVFQSYNLIPHQSVLTNVELALTISGVSKAERRRRAVEALQKVGLGDQIHKKPNQMSGGQMQRVAIARAIVNDPEILLADEPTGALDSTTSLQIMEILREIASDRLVIMVTHNPDLAEQYSTRIIRLQDGLVTDDSDPYDAEKASVPVRETKKKKKALSLKTALSLSLNNLMTKKARTFLTSFAGSIGIIGIALILSLSSGINAYIMTVQEEALSSYPITLQQETQDYSAMFSAMMDAHDEAQKEVEEGKIYVSDSMVNMFSAMMSTTKNDLAAFKKVLDSHPEKLEGALSEVRYTYNFNLQVYSEDGKTQVNPTTLFEHMGEEVSGMLNMMTSSSSLYASTYTATMSMFREMLANTDLLKTQYDLVGENSKWADEPEEVMLVIGENNSITNMVLYALGLADQNELEELMKKILAGETLDLDYGEYTFDDFIGMTFYIVPNSDFYVKTNETYTVDGKTYPVWSDVRTQDNYDQAQFAKEHGIPVRISGIIRKNPDALAGSLMAGTIVYNGSLSEKIMKIVQGSEVAIQQTEKTPDHDILSGLPYDNGQYNDLKESEKIALFEQWIDGKTMEKAELALTLLSTASAELAQKQVEAMTAPEKIEYVAAHFMELADVSPEAFMPIIMNIMKATMGEQFKQYESAFASMTPEEFVEALRSLGAFNITEQKPEEAAMLIELLGQFPKEQIDQLAVLLVEAQLSGDQANQLLEQYTTAQLAELFDEAYEKLTDAEKALLFKKSLPHMLSDGKYAKRIVDLGFVDFENPASISLYAKDFESKDLITEFISEYNSSVDDSKQITYTDLVGLMMSSITTIIDAISYVLIAFVSISLVVSSIMIGIITYISVLERTKEIGILRAIGASKHDISRVFNAETLIVGFCAGLIGILATILLCIPINAIIHYISGINTINAILPVSGGVTLVLISMLLTLIAGLVPARLAAKKDPVRALRTE